MKLKKFLSLILAVGSLVTVSSFLNSNAIGLNDNNELQPREINQQMRTRAEREAEIIGIINRNNRTRRLYRLVLLKCLAPMKRGGNFGANISYIRNMAENIDDYTDFIALYYRIAEERVNDAWRARFVNICNDILNYADDFFVQMHRDDNDLHQIAIDPRLIRRLDFDE